MGSKAGKILKACLFAAVGGGVSALLWVHQAVLTGTDPRQAKGYVLPVLFGAALGMVAGACAGRLKRQAEFRAERTRGPRPRGKRIRVVAEPGYDRVAFRVPVRMTA